MEASSHTPCSLSFPSPRLCSSHGVISLRIPDPLLPPKKYLLKYQHVVFSPLLQCPWVLEEEVLERHQRHLEDCWVYLMGLRDGPGTSWGHGDNVHLLSSIKALSLIYNCVFISVCAYILSLSLDCKFLERKNRVIFTFVSPGASLTEVFNNFFVICLNIVKSEFESKNHFFSKSASEKKTVQVVKHPDSLSNEVYAFALVCVQKVLQIFHS